MLVENRRSWGPGNPMESSDDAIIKWVKYRIHASKFENDLWQCHHSNTVRAFIHQPAVTNIFVTVDQESNQLIVCSGVPPEPSSGRVDVTYFIKAEGQILSLENLDETLIYGTIVIKQTASSVLEIMEREFYPNIFDSREWNQSSKQELQGLYHRFMASLTESANEESGTTDLYLPFKKNKDFDEETTLCDKNAVQQLEAVAIHWIRQVKEVLNSHEHNINLDHQGPMEELRFWEARAKDLAGISQQLYRPEVHDILSILKETKSKYAKPVEALSAALHQGSEEAANSVKFLRLLQGPCELLAKLEAAEIPCIMLKFLNCIRLIHVHSANYNTIEKVSDLIRRVSSEIIRQCTFQVSLQEIFHGDLEKAMTTLNDCIKCGKAWKERYNRMTVTVNKQKNEEGSTEEHWKLNDPSIFAEMDAFVQRCDDLIDICNSRVQFIERLDGTFNSSDKKYLPTFGWTNGPGIENSVRVVQEAFLVQINRLNGLKYSIVNARESRWHGDYNAFKMATKDLDTMLVNIIHGALEQVQVIDAAAHLVQIFHRIAHRPAIKHCMEKRAIELRGLFLRQCQKIRHDFDNNYRRPPLRKNEPIGAGSALWANALCASLETGWNSICNASVESVKYDSNVEKVYSELVQALTMYRKQKYLDWIESLAGLDASELQERLDQPLLRALNETKNGIINPLASNFDSEVISILTEAAFWDKLHNEDFETPNEILGICHQREVLRVTHERVMMLVRAYNDFLHDLKGTSMLYFDHLKLLEKRLRPGFIKILWSTRPVVIDKFVQTMLDMIHSFHRNVRKFHCGTFHIQDSCQKIASTLMIRVDHNLDYNALQFESIQTLERSKGKDVIFKCRDEIELEANKIFEQFKDGSKEVHFEWTTQLQRFDNMILVSLMKAVRLSLKEFAVAVDVDAIPLFSTDSYLQDGQIDCRPSLISITNAANNIAKHTVSVAKGLSTLSKNQDKRFDTKRFYDAVASDEIVLNRIVTIMNRMSACAFNVSEKLIAYDKYRSLWSMDLKSYLRRYSKSSVPNYKRDIQNSISRRALVEAEESLCTVNFVQLDFTSLKAELCNHALNFKAGLVELLKKTMDTKISDIYVFIHESSELLVQPILTIDDLGGVIELLAQVEKRCEGMEHDFPPLCSAKEVLNEYDTDTLGIQGYESLAKLDGIETAFTAFLGCISSTQETISKARVELKKQFQETLSEHNTFQMDLILEVDEALHKADISNTSDAAQVLKELEDGMMRSKSREQELQIGLDLFQLDLMELKKLQKAKARVDHMASTLSLSEKWDAIRKKWTETSLSSVDFNDMTNDIKLCVSGLYSMDGDIREWSFWTTIKRDIDKFRALSPLMIALGNVAMQDRHWQSIQDQTGKEFIFSDELTLGTAQSLGLEESQHAQVIFDISDSASKEYSIEKSLNEIEVFLVNCRLDFIPYKETSLKVSVPDDFFTILEDNQVTISAAETSPAGKPFASRIRSLGSILKEATDLFEIVLLVQRQWIYLENIFQGAGDISERLPLESEKFSHVNKIVTTTILQFQMEQNVQAILICKEISITKLHGILTQMEDIQSSLKQYLESKRRGFPRFYFISDDDLLEMIGRGSHPQLTHIQKCFEGIRVLKLKQNEDCTWCAMGGESRDEEVIMFNNPVHISGSIEEWMQRILDEMKATMATLLENAFIDKKVLKPLEWVPKWQGQLLITSGALVYTKRCERALLAIKSGRDKNALRGVRKKYISFLRRLTEMVRSEDIDATNRSKAVALITMEIHNRDVIEKMIRFPCLDPNDFVWSSQLRFYLNAGLCEVHQNNYSFKFGYEYQGNNGRLVITPLTDRCVLTLLTALSLHRGGNPLGPAGTGKTETVKDLAKNLAFFCVVTNCGENLDYKSLGRIFSGLCQSGSWGCFDEFNRIKIEVLSVAAVQIGSILNASRNSLDSFSFLGNIIPFKVGTGIFITMNPGYAGRTELPDNLKALLRPVAMMTPDLVLIAEVILTSEGFASGKILAQRMIAIYRLMKQQLSKCSHYDFGLRNIKSVLTMAGSLKRQNSNGDEAMIIIRSLVGLNEPRFLGKDKELFRFLLADLFPGKNLDLSPDALLLDMIEKVMRSNGVYPDNALIEKTAQLAHSQNTRHSNMLIGETMTGKTTIWKNLSIAKTKLDPHHPNYASIVNTHVLNPKALSVGELYGAYDMATFEWSDGVLSTLFKRFAEHEGGKGSEHWIIFDGPVDALWIESMNSVMDDSKLLTLINGDRVFMTNSMSLLFEVEDLQVASPATVSRAGMIFVDCVPGWRAVVDKWLDAAHFGESLTKKAFILSLCEKYLESVLSFKRVNCLEPVPLNDVTALISFTQLYGDLLSSRHVTDRSRPDTDKTLAEKMFIFCLAWTIGGALDSHSRKLFDRHLRVLESKLMPTRSIYKYFIDSEKHDFVPWTKMLNSVPANIEIPCCAIMVPTIDTVRHSFILSSFADNGHRILITGERGTGKTAICRSYLQKLPPQSYHTSIGLSRTTASSFLQTFVSASLERISKGTFGPRLGLKRLIVFLDDLNLPEKTSEESPSQPPLELMRQLIDYGGWYNRSTCSFEKVVKTDVLCAMAHPTGGRDIISGRTQSRFSILNCSECDEKQLVAIFSSLLHCKLAFLPHNVTEAIGNIADATVAVFTRIRKVYLPIPGKKHYKFDLRDILRVAYGMCLISRKNCYFHTKNDLCALWQHECVRTFSDRFVDDLDKDKERFWRILDEVQRNHSLTPLDGDIPSYSPISQVYQRCKDKFEQQASKYLVDYNESGSFIPMSLVLFQDAVNHLSRIQRVLMLERGNMLFVGVGGSGRESLSRLAAFASGFEFFRIEASRKYKRKEFLDDLKILSTRCGLDNKKVLFFLKDTDIQEEKFLEDVSSLLDSGEVHGCFGKEDVLAVCAGVRKDAAEAGLHESEDSLWKFFIERVRKNLRIIMAFSSSGNSFSSRVESFPALMNCAVVNWFNPWPASGLEQIASDQVLGTVDEQELCLPDQLPRLIATLHDSAARTAVEMQSSIQRYNYVTPTNYLEFIRTFKQIYTKKGTDLKSQRAKLSGGLKKLQKASGQVASMRVTLEKKQIIVKESQEKCESMLEQIMVDKKRTEEQKQAVEIESEQISLEERECSIIAQDAEADLAIALPALQKAFAEVDKIDKSSLTELKAYANPPVAVEKVLSCVMIFMDKPTDWASAKRSLGDINFLSDLKSYNKDDVRPAILLRVSKFVVSPSFAPPEITRISKAAGALCSWCHAIHMYSNVAKEVAPKRERLKLAQESLAEKQIALHNAKDALEQATIKLANLKEKYDESVKEKNVLAHEAKTLAEKLERAEKLVNGLSSEYKRWTFTISALNYQSDCLIGDVLVASAFLSYAGPFETSFRANLVTEWVEIVERNGIQISKDFSVKNVLANDKDIQTWNNQGLSKDAFSIENALIINNSSRWPLIIDPQSQATKWLQAMYGDTLKVLDMKKKEDMRELETAISFGLPVLIHNVLEELDLRLNPVLSKAIIKSGRRNFLRLGDKEIAYNESFRLFIITKLGNPHYPPEVLAKTTLVNFATTRMGLEEQLLALIVTEEAPALESKKRDITNKLFTGRNRLIELEDDILRILSRSMGNLIDDFELIKTLQDSKHLADAVNLQLKQAEETAMKVDAARNVYRNAAIRSSTIFFTVASMSHVDPMYQFSLDSYLADFQVNITNSRIPNGNFDPQPSAEDRVKAIMKHHPIETFKSICTALFEKDKILFALQLCCDVMLEEGLLSSTELDFICYGLSASNNIDVSKYKSSFKWMEEKAKVFLPHLEHVVSGITKNIEQDEDSWREWYQSESPETHNLPKFCGQDIPVSDLHRLCILRAFRFDRFINGARILVKKQMGEQFISSHSFDLLNAFNKSTSKIPLLIILSPGVDPVSQVLQVADEHSQKLVQVSLGQGQGPLAIEAIEKATVSGDWVFLANCHIMPTFMDNLEAVITRLQTGNVNNRFRLWLSSKPTSIFPLSILQKSVKITTENPRGLGANLLHIYSQINQHQFDVNGEKYGFKKLLFGLAWVHCILIERRKFKSLGFNVHYDFCDSDFSVCNDILGVMLGNDDGIIPFDALRILIGEANYGGRVTDEWDRKLLNVYMKNLFCQEAVDQHSFALSSDGDGEYTIPPDGPLDSYKSYINSLPTYDDPKAFGQHTNAQVASQVEAAKRLLGSISLLRHDTQNKGTSFSNSNTAGLQSLEKLKAVPQCLDTKNISAYENHSLDSSAMKTFLIQETERYNELLTVIHCTREDLKDAIDGKTILNPILETQLKTLSEFQVPKQWQRLYNSCKLLDSWIADLCNRVRQLELWIENGAPKAFWIGGFSNPSGFFTAVLQTEARKKCISIDLFTWSFKVTNVLENDLDIPSEGVYVSGLFLEGASYDVTSDCLLDPKPMELLYKMPIMYFYPTEFPNKSQCKQYTCPMYICPDRAGSNQLPSYFFSLKLNAGEKSTDHWVKRGVAVLLSSSE